MPTAAEVFAALPALAEHDLKQIRDRCSALLVLGNKRGARAGKQPDDFSILLFDALTAEAGKFTQGAGVPYDVFTRSATGRRYVAAAELAEQAHKRWVRDKSAAERLSMCRLYAELTVAWVRGRELPLRWSALVVGTQQLPALVERAFPGYAMSGAMQLVLKTRTNPNQREGAARADE